MYQAREVPAQSRASWDADYIGYENLVAADLLLGFGRTMRDEAD